MTLFPPRRARVDWAAPKDADGNDGRYRLLLGFYLNIGETASKERA